MFIPDIAIRVGDKWMSAHGVARVMAFAEQHVMARYPRCIPFALSEKEFRAQFVWIDSVNAQEAETTTNR